MTRWHFFKRSDSSAPSDSTQAKREASRYFQTARRWADDIHLSALASRHRYQVAFLVMTGLAIVLAASLLVLLPLQRTQLVVVHQGPSGYTWVSTTAPPTGASASWPRTQAEIAHYVSVRESYDPVLYAYQTNEVKMLSSSAVLAAYEQAQSSHNPKAPINLLGTKGYRTVVVNNVLLLDSVTKNQPSTNHHINLAQVDYVVDDHYFGQGQTINTPYTALVSWEYQGTPDNPSTLLNDWDGFTITKFTVTPTNVNNHSDEE